MKIGSITIPISHCIAGIYLRWWWSGWHYWNFTNGYEITMTSESIDTHVTRMFSVISKIERATKLKAEYSYQITLEGITAENIPGFTGLLLAEKVEQYENNKWYEVDITRGDHLIKDANAPGYILNFEITRKDRANTSTVYQKSIKLYLGDTLCDLDDDEVIPINKQVNDIAEMQDRQSDFTAQFKIRKTRAMRALFELSGEVGANTTFPYENQTCRLVQNGIEMITGGQIIIDRVDDQYYYVSILSGNLNLFKAIDKLKLSDITTIADHIWSIGDIKIAQDLAALPDYLYPLCEPSDDSGIAAPGIVGNAVNMYAGYVWPFFRVQKLWEEIFAAQDYTVSGDITTNPFFMGLYLPISSVEITKAYSDKFLYSVWWGGSHVTALNDMIAFTGAVLINGDESFRTGLYYANFTASYKITVSVIVLTGTPTLSVYRNGALIGNMTAVLVGTVITYEYTVTATPLQYITILTTAALYYYYSVAITEITGATLAYGSVIVAANHLPDLSQTDFLKLICNMFGLIPEVTARDHKIKFWNYADLYDNMAIARDWSAYLSEREDETEFKFGDYAQSNFLNYNSSDDVIKDNGKGIMQVLDETLPAEKDVMELSVSTCDEVIIATTTPVTVSRIAFNKYDNKIPAAYAQEDSIDSRIVYVKRATGREFIVWDTVGMATNHVHVDDVRIASSLEISFSNLVTNYSSLSRMLTKTNLRRAKFNLPVYEVAGLKHYIPIYLSQYKAYFYVNKINNFVPGQLCTIDLIKL